MQLIISCVNLTVSVKYVITLASVSLQGMAVNELIFMTLHKCKLRASKLIYSKKDDLCLHLCRILLVLEYQK